MTKHADLCIYKINKESSFKVEITECAPEVFSKIREVYGVTTKELIDAFSPINNNQAIRNFSTGSGKSSSFFLFTDNK
jgi:hypothetical protein